MFARTHMQRFSISRNLNEVSITGTHSRVEIDIRLVTNHETEDQDEEGVGLNEMKDAEQSMNIQTVDGY